MNPATNLTNFEHNWNWLRLQAGFTLRLRVPV